MLATYPFDAFIVSDLGASCASAQTIRNHAEAAPQHAGELPQQRGSRSLWRIRILQDHPRRETSLGDIRRIKDASLRWR
jgi:hypothetical protein